ncbi:hypothetical protein GGR56DRAFT_672193 [Xylariaceae sp. FL0804]|nr:hypothetical protein GGR56DRAFT_672193 [Xylariaceae sp. FL0804]
MFRNALYSLATISGLASLAHCAPIQERQIQFCASADQPTIVTYGDAVTGTGVYITNNDVDPNVKYFFYENTRDDHPLKYLDIPIGSTAFVQVCSTFQGRIQRGTPAVNLDGQPHLLGTWVEFSISAGSLYADVSFLQGADGGAQITTTDGTDLSRGCTANLLTGAPAAALRVNDAGNAVVDTIVDSSYAAGNAVAKAWLLQQCGADDDQVFIQDPNVAGESIIDSTNGRLAVQFVGGVA